MADRTVTLYSASKSFNMGGMCCALAHIGPDKLLRDLAALPGHLLGRVSLPSVATTLACWSAEGDRWLERCLTRLRGNRAVLAQWLEGPGGSAGVRALLPEATYLAWLDFRPAGLGTDPAAALLAEAKVALSPGPAFGPGGEGFARLNFATSPGLLEQLLSRLAGALT